MSKEKICFKSDGTKETGAKIIKALEELGGINKSNYHGDIRNHYYFIIEDADNVITWELIIPQDYTLKDIHTWNNTPSKEELLEEAKKRYPIGTEFKSFEDDGCIRTVTPWRNRKECIWKFHGDNIISDNGIGDNAGCSNPYIYKDGKWAEIVSLPENNTPSKDKPFYVVVTEENKEVLSKWRGVNLTTNKIAGLCLNDNGKLEKNQNPIGETKGNTYDFGNEITFEQFLELYPECKENDKPKYKIGSWYKSCVGKNTYYFKVIDIKNQSFSELKVNFVDRCSTYRDAHSISYNSPIDDNAILLTDLSEIQQYLPDGHVDKIVEIVVPEYVECIADTGWSEVTIGTIWKTDTYPYNKEYRLVWEDGSGQTTRGKEHCFKPSTKEAYESFKKGDSSTVIEEFMLPEKWCIVRTPENCDTINKWFSNRHTSKFSANGVWFNSMQKDYMHFPFIGQKVYQHKIEEGYTEITFEQFKKYVLEEKDEFVYAPTDTFKQALDEKWVPKVGDWVIVKGYCDEYDGKPLQITHVYKLGGYLYCNFNPCKNSKANFDVKHIVKQLTEEEVLEHLSQKDITWEIDVSYARPENIKNLSKTVCLEVDYTKLSKEEILEIAKEKYKDALEVIPFFDTGDMCNTSCYIDRPIRNLPNGIEYSCGFIYLWDKPGVWAEITKYKDAFDREIDCKPYNWIVAHEEAVRKQYEKDAQKYLYGTHAGFTVTPEMLNGIWKTSEFNEENILPTLKIKKKKLLLNIVSDVESITSKLITNNKKVKL